MARSLSLGNTELGPDLFGQSDRSMHRARRVSAAGGQHWATNRRARVARGVRAWDSPRALWPWARRSCSCGVSSPACSWAGACRAASRSSRPRRRRRERGVAIMMLFTGYGAGATVAGLVAAAFADSGGWRAVMVVRRRGLHRYGGRRVVVAANPVARRRCAARRGCDVQRERIRHRALALPSRDADVVAAVRRDADDQLLPQLVAAHLLVEVGRDETSCGDLRFGILARRHRRGARNRLVDRSLRCDAYADLVRGDLGGVAVCRRPDARFGLHGIVASSARGLRVLRPRRVRWRQRRAGELLSRDRCERSASAGRRASAASVR